MVVTRFPTDIALNMADGDGVGKYWNHEQEESTEFEGF
jgi:hypothetical protein